MAPSDPQPHGRPSVIVRTRDSAATIGGLLDDIESQTVSCELVVVDSGSTDATLDLVGRRCDRLVRLRPGEYTPGRALNAGAKAAGEEIHVALSSHCRLRRRDWLERVLGAFADAAVAAVNGADHGPDGARLGALFLQTAADARVSPGWGFSNHASAWRASVWREHPFLETLPTVEDKEWALRVLDAGWKIAYVPGLEVDMTHRWRQGALNFYRRTRQEHAVLGTYVELPPYGAQELVREWWWPERPRRAVGVERANPRRLLGLLGKYAGHRAARRASR
jgi:rhamnosyltransferase